MFENSILKPLSKEFAKEINNWECESPYEAYSNHMEDFWVMELASSHKTLEERAAEFAGKLKLDGEYDWGEPAGREKW